MKIWLIKDHQGKFHPLNNTDREKADKIPVMEDNLFTFKRVRNPKFHRKYFALIKLAFDNQDQYDDQDKFRKVMQMKAGFYDVVKDKEIMYWPKSIAFDKLDEDGFQDLYDKVWAVLEKEYGFDNELFEQELNQFI